MPNGIILGNSGAKSDKGSGVFVEGNGVFTMIGGEILNNASKLRGVVYGEFNMSGGTISGNSSAESGGVFVSPYGGTFNKTSGIVSGNTPN
jgi:hypothetical protein